MSIDDQTKRSAIVLIVRRGLNHVPEILSVTNRQHGGLGLPGGKVEPGEEVRGAACRELHEETGVVTRPEDLSLLAVGKTTSDSGRMVSLFFARFAWGPPRSVERGTRVIWSTMRELEEGSPFAAFYRRWLPDGVYHLRNTIFGDQSVAPRSRVCDKEEP